MAEFTRYQVEPVSVEGDDGAIDLYQEGNTDDKRCGTCHGACCEMQLIVIPIDDVRRVLQAIIHEANAQRPATDPKLMLCTMETIQRTELQIEGLDDATT